MTKKIYNNTVDELLYQSLIQSIKPGDIFKNIEDIILKLESNMIDRVKDIEYDTHGIFYSDSAEMFERNYKEVYNNIPYRNKTHCKIRFKINFKPNSKVIVREIICDDDKLKYVNEESKNFSYYNIFCVFEGNPFKVKKGKEVGLDENFDIRKDLFMTIMSRFLS